VEADTTMHVDVRSLAGANRDLKEDVENGHFRRDLYHRLSVFPVEVPPLRHRHGDIPLLAGYFAEKMRLKLGLKSLRIAPEALSQMGAYSWLGNVRELEHVISRASLRARSEQQRGIATIESRHCDLIDGGQVQPIIFRSTRDIEPDASQEPENPADNAMNDALADFQRNLISERLAANNQNWSQAAKSLGMDRGNLHRMAKRLGLKSLTSRP